MRTSFALIATLASILGLQHHVFAETTTQWKGTAALTFAGTSTLHDWSGTVKAQPFLTTVGMTDSTKPSSIKAKVEVKVVEMDTKEPKRDENLRKAMRMADFPLVTGEIDTEFPKLMPGIGTAPQVLPIQLTLLGKSHSVMGVITNWKQNGDKASFDLDFEVSLKASGIRVPSVMLVIRVGDVVKVHAEITLQNTNA
ncbi:YceI-like domain-containing protein [Roseimicrobium gellanilyticum]|uniref:YceI-like domain-containing protein n=1 Tax=Roseimicrobium gellanilyticum TaxID=748857 RepID=A0A366H7N2_9BACT|nr:YceI family protein [Roseimicrobium gellanilyticum]RBP38181.1 YceI-like domain-containing protein [Roseimicrobium gellanilyticum]